VTPAFSRATVRLRLSRFWFDVVQAFRLAGASRLPDTADLKVCTTPTLL
jgi:hypothetical protein